MKKRGTINIVRISNPGPLPCLTLNRIRYGTKHTHTERTVTPTSSPMAIAEYIAALTRVLMMWVGRIAE